MIQDSIVLAEVRRDWAGVEALRIKLKVSALASASTSGGIYPFAIAKAAHNLPFVHAYAVLNDVLRQVRNEQRFKYKSDYLSPLLDASKAAIPWRDFSLIDAGRERRNEVAHDGVLLDTPDCWKYIDAIKAELTAWGIL